MIIEESLVMQYWLILHRLHVLMTSIQSNIDFDKPLCIM